MMKFKIVVFLLLCLSTNTYSNVDETHRMVKYDFKGYLDYFNMGDHTGNGGDVVICNNGSKKTYRVLDNYEVEELHFLKSRLSSSASRTAVLKELIQRFSCSSHELRLQNALSQNRFLL